MPRFEPDATDRAGARRYLVERAHQALRDGFHPCGELEPLVDADIEWGARALARSREGGAHQTVYVYAAHRGLGHLSRHLRATSDVPVVTLPDCAIEAWLAARGFAFVVVGRATEWPEYKAIAQVYGDRCAARSGVPYMHHIDEGLAVLDRIGASERAARAFCLHPLVQADADLLRTYPSIAAITPDPCVLALALEYRATANATLSHRAIASAAEIPLSPLAEVAQMLVADKVQNRKDFILEHRATHPRRRALDRYFALWLERLGVSPARFAELFVDLQVSAHPVSLEAALARSSGASPAAEP